MSPLILALAMQVAEPQPIPFNHRLHASRGIACASCHGGPGARMGTMGATGCAACHRAKSAKPTPDVRKVDDHARRGVAIPWERIYQLPSRVHFDHRRHATAACAACHGPVDRRDALAEEVIINMKFCRDCHLRTGAKVACGTCHEEK